MLLSPILTKEGHLILEAYSYDEKELDAVTKVLFALNLSASYKELAPDKVGRTGREYSIHKDKIYLFEQHLDVRFKGTERRTLTLISEEEQGYRCQEICLHGDGEGCINFSAKGDPEAIVKCSLIASNKGWLGGIASLGSCYKRTGLTGKIGKLFGNIAGRSRNR